MKFEFVCLPTKGIEFGEGIVRMIFVIDAVDSFVPYIACFLVFFVYVTVIRPQARFVFCKTKGNIRKEKENKRVVFSKRREFRVGDILFNHLKPPF